MEYIPAAHPGVLDDSDFIDGLNSPVEYEFDDYGDCEDNRYSVNWSPDDDERNPDRIADPSTETLEIPYTRKQIRMGKK